MRSAVTDTALAKWRFGLFGGGTAAQLYGGAVSPSQTHYRWTGGLSAALHTGHRMVLAFEPSLAQINSIVPVSGGNVRITLDYLPLPLLVRFEPAVMNGPRPRIFLGGAYALRLACKIRVEANGPLYSSQCAADSDNIESPFVAFRNGVWAGAVGGAVAFPQRRATIILGVRADLGLTRVSTERGPRYRVLAASLGLERAVAKRLPKKGDGVSAPKAEVKPVIPATRRLSSDSTRVVRVDSSRTEDLFELSSGVYLDEPPI